jgi:hypothetical protein
MPSPENFFPNQQPPKWLFGNEDLPSAPEAMHAKEATPVKEVKFVESRVDVTSRAEAKAKLKESDKTWGKFLMENEKALQQVIGELRFQHNNYMADLSGLHQHLQRDVKKLVDLKYGLERFICPSALATSALETVKLSNVVETDESNVALENDAPKINAVTPTGTPRTNKSQVANSPCQVSSCESDVLTETAFKDHLFMSMLPLYNLQEHVSASLLPLQDQMKRLEDCISTAEFRSRPLIPAQELPDKLPAIDREKNFTEQRTEQLACIQRRRSRFQSKQDA